MKGAVAFITGFVVVLALVGDMVLALARPSGLETRVATLESSVASLFGNDIGHSKNEEEISCLIDRLITLMDEDKGINPDPAVSCADDASASVSAGGPGTPAVVGTPATVAPISRPMLDIEGFSPSGTGCGMPPDGSRYVCDGQPAPVDPDSRPRWAAVPDIGGKSSETCVQNDTGGWNCADDFTASSAPDFLSAPFLTRDAFASAPSPGPLVPTSATSGITITAVTASALSDGRRAQYLNCASKPPILSAADLGADLRAMAAYAYGHGAMPRADIDVLSAIGNCLATKWMAP